MTLETTPERTLELLKQAVAERGEDFVFPKEWCMLDVNTEQLTGTCSYVRRDVDEPACIVGYVLHAYGLALDDLRHQEGQGSHVLSDKYGVDQLTRAMLGAAQHAQDNHKTWGFAVKQAEAEYNSAIAITRG